ncbi:hypothetical protein BC830DRAFT_143318 [Chytriomyces sp. MP71]|nr:hypothetical protein BC830DRAFT_143318 [Chytriomyces sp. MP71]
MATTSSHVTNAVRKAVLRHALTIKNSGRLNPKFSYFRASNGAFVTGISTSAIEKFHTVAADSIVFAANFTHVLLIFRCPHDHSSNRTCADNILDTTSFQYKGCLATPGGFYDPIHDIDQATHLPDFTKTATRELSEECPNLRMSTAHPLRFLSAEFNNLRDIRWLTSPSYLPSCAPQFWTLLDSAETATGFPRIHGSDDACGNAIWVDTRIVDQVYAAHRALYDAFDEIPFDPAVLRDFVASDRFLKNPATGMPRNKLAGENAVLAGMRESGEDAFVVDWQEGREYQFGDFAFDHVRNIARAKEAGLKERRDEAVLNCI